MKSKLLDVAHETFDTSHPMTCPITGLPKSPIKPVTHRGSDKINYSCAMDCLLISLMAAIEYSDEMKTYPDYRASVDAVKAILPPELQTTPVGHFRNFLNPVKVYSAEHFEELPIILKLVSEVSLGPTLLEDDIILTGWVDSYRDALEETLFLQSASFFYRQYLHDAARNFTTNSPPLFQWFATEEGSFFGKEDIFKRNPYTLTRLKRERCSISSFAASGFSDEMHDQIVDSNNYAECLLNMLRYIYVTLKPGLTSQRSEGPRSGGGDGTLAQQQQQQQQRRVVSLIPMRYSFIMFYVYNLQMEHVIQKRVANDEYMTIQYKHADCAFESILPKHYPTRSVTFNPNFNGLSYESFRDGLMDEEAFATSYLFSPQESHTFGFEQEVITRPSLGPIDTLLTLKHVDGGKLSLLSVPLLLTPSVQVDWEDHSLESILEIDASEEVKRVNTPPGFFCGYQQGSSDSETTDVYGMVITKRYLEQQLNDNYTQIGETFCFVNTNQVHVVSISVEDLKFVTPHPTLDGRSIVSEYTPVSYVFNKKGIHFTADGIISSGYGNSNTSTVTSLNSGGKQDWHYDNMHDLGVPDYGSDLAPGGDATPTAEYVVHNNFVSLGSETHPKPTGVPLVDPAKSYRVVSYYNSRTEEVTDHLMIKVCD